MPDLKILLTSTELKSLKSPREEGITFEHSAPTPQWSRDRVKWDLNDPNQDPVFEDGGDDHFNSYRADGFIRGGAKVNLDRRRIDFKRMSSFIYSKLFSDFTLRQAALQALNPQSNTKIYNAGVNMMAQIGGVGLINIKRHGLAPFPGGIDDKNVSPTYLHYFDDVDLDVVVKRDGDGKIESTEIQDNGKGIGDLQNEKNMAGIPVREKQYSMGDPGGSSWKLNLQNLTGISAFAKKEAYNMSFEESYSKVDLINKVDILRAQNGEVPAWASDYVHDMVNFRFEVVDDHDLSKTNIIIFRAFLDDFSDSFQSSHNEYKYNGRGEKFYTYESFDRKIGVNFKIAAQTRHEMRPLYKKLNYLAAQTAPNYSKSGRIRTPYMKLTVGDYFNRIPGVLTSVGIKWGKDYPFEIKSHPERDKDMLILPHILDVSVSFQPIHGFTPNNSISAPFIGINKWINKLEHARDPETIPEGQAAIDLPANDALSAGLTYVPENNQKKADRKEKMSEQWNKFKDMFKSGKVDPNEAAKQITTPTQ